MSKICNSCYLEYPNNKVKQCPVCGFETCEYCECLDENDKFIFCENCAERVVNDDRK